MPNSGRFEALDSLRGICACMVALFHFSTAGVITNLAIVRNGWLFVDFFFVLSGFVIANAYRQRLAEGFSGWRFLALRLGRIYPLHAAVLLVMLAIEIIFSMIGNAGFTLREAFGEGRTLGALLATFALLNTFNLPINSGWNAPSWSIAAEFWAYAVFAIVILAARRHATIAFALIAVVAVGLLPFLTGNWLNVTFDFGFVRCLYGFSIGVVLLSLWQRLPAPSSFGVASLAELAICLLCAGFVAAIGQGPATLLAPLLFAAAVLIFSHGQGAVSRLLHVRPFQWLGLLSYSIYMIHALVQARFFDLLDLAGKMTGVALTGHGRGGMGDVLVIEGPAADAITVAMMLVLIGCAALSYRLVELPGRSWSRRLLLDKPARSTAVEAKAEAQAPTF